MSWRLFILPYLFNDDVTIPLEAYADWIISEQATREMVEDIADAAYWKCPLKIYTQQRDKRLNWLLRRLNDEYGMARTDLSVIVRKPKQKVSA